MKIIRYILLTVFVISLAYGQRVEKSTAESSDFIESRSFDSNNILMRKVTNRGDFNSSLWTTLKYGTLNAKRIVFDAGLWMTGLIDDKVHSAIKFYSANYSPGPILEGQPAMVSHPEDSLQYRVYKIFRGDNSQNPDYQEWPNQFGAPVDNSGKPLLYGDQTLWTVYNMFDSSSVDTNYVENKSNGILPIEVQQTIYGREGEKEDFENIFHNIVFIEWTIINKGLVNIDSAFIGLWADIDFYDINSNIPAVDVNKSTGYLWSGIDFTPTLRGVPPSVGISLLYGPAVPSENSVAVFKGDKKNGFKNLYATSFHGIGDDLLVSPLYGPPRTEKQVYNAANGFSNTGSIIIEPDSATPTKFPFNGDPVTNTGWLFPEDEVGNGSGFILFSGPFNLAVSDTQWVMAALVPGLGVDNKESITKMRDKIDILRSMPYDSLAFGKDPAVITGIESHEKELPKQLALHQNYPNPFNPITTIKFDVPQGIENKIRLSVFNILGQEIINLADKEFSPGTYSVKFDGSDLSSGIYFYRIQSQSTIITRKMILLK